MGRAPERNTGHPESPREGRDQPREAQSVPGKLHEDSGTPEQQRQVRKLTDEQARKSMEKTQEFTPADHLLTMLHQVKRTGHDANKGGNSGSDRSQEIKEAPAAKASMPVDKRVAAAADAIWKSTNQDSYVRSADSKGILDVLRDNTKTEAQRKELQADYAAKHGQTMEQGLKKVLSTSDFQRAQDYLNGKAHGDKRDVSDVSANLKEMGQWTGPRSSQQVEKDLTESVASKTPAELRKLDENYKAEHGKTFKEAIAGDPNLSGQSKETIAAYMDSTRDAQGKLASEDVQKLAGVALKYGDSASLASVMKGASPEARDRFFAEGGKEKMQEMMHDPGERKLLPKTAERKWSSGEYMQALEIARSGELSAATKIRDNSGITGNNDKANDAALQQMTPEQRNLYIQGREMVASGQVDRKSDAYKYYQNLHTAIEDSTRFDARRASMQDKVEHEGGSIISKIADKHAGTLYNDGAEKIKDTVSKNMTQKDFELYKSDPKYHDQVQGFLKNTMKLSDSDVASVTSSLDQAKDYQQYKISTSGEKSPEHVPLGRQVAEKGEGVWNNKQEFLHDFLREPAEKRQQLLKSSLGGKVTGGLNEEQKQVLDRLSKSDAVQPADLMRAHVVGLGVSKEELSDRLSKLSPEQKEQLKTDYANNYKLDALADLTGSKTGIERDKWVDLLKRPPASTAEAMSDMRKQYVQSRGFEKGAVDSWDGTRTAYMDNYHATRENLVQAKARGEITPQNEAQHVENLHKENEKRFAERERLVESRTEVANAAVTGVTTLAGLGVAGATVKGLMIGGALLKAGTHEAVVGADGDTSTSGRFHNLATGAAEGAMLKFAPGASNAEASLASKASGNVAAAMASTLPGVGSDTWRHWDANKSAKENAQDGLERGAVSMVTAGGTALGLSVAHAAGGAIRDRVAKLAGEVPAIHVETVSPAGKVAPVSEHSTAVQSGRAAESQPAASSPELQRTSVVSERSSAPAAGHHDLRAGDKALGQGDKVVYKGDGKEYVVRAKVDEHGLVLASDGPGSAPRKPVDISPDRLREDFPAFNLDGKSYVRNGHGQVFELTSTLDKSRAQAMTPEVIKANYQKIELGSKTFYQSPRSGTYYELDKTGHVMVKSSGPQIQLDPDLRFVARNNVEKGLTAAETASLKPAATPERSTIAGTGNAEVRAGDKGSGQGEKVVYKGDGQEYVIQGQVDKSGLVLAKDTPAGASNHKRVDISHEKIADNFLDFTMNGKSYVRNGHGQVFELTSTLDKSRARVISPEDIRANYEKIELGSKTFYQSPRSGNYYELNESGNVIMGSSGPQIQLNPNLRIVPPHSVQRGLPAAEAPLLKPQASSPSPEATPTERLQSKPPKDQAPEVRPVKSTPAAEVDPVTRRAELQGKAEKLDAQAGLMLKYANALQDEAEKGPAARQEVEALLRENGLKNLIVKTNYGKQSVNRMMGAAQIKWRLADMARTAIRQLDQP